MKKLVFGVFLCSSLLFFSACKKNKSHDINYTLTSDFNENIVFIYGLRAKENSIVAAKIDTIKNGYLSVHKVVEVGYYAHSKIIKPTDVDTLTYTITIIDETTNKVLGAKNGISHNATEEWDNIYEVEVVEE